jgi:hypothetical protein
MLRVCSLALAAFLGAESAHAGLMIGFENTPGGNTPTDNASLDTPYAIDGGTVRFFFDVNGNNVYDAGDVDPSFEARGNADAGPQGFVSTKNGGQDLPAGGDLGNWFIRQPDGIGVLPGPFLIDYDVSQTIDSLSGEIWDIDSASAQNTEQWLVEVLDSAGSVVASKLSPLGLLQSDPSSLDSLPWTFTFTGLSLLSTDVDKVRMTFVGGKTDGIGLSFNNFSPFTAVPEPSSLALGGTGLALAGLAYLRRRRHSA